MSTAYQYDLNLSGMSDELRLLFSLLRAEYDQDEAAKLESRDNSSINWELFIELAKHHRVYPLIISSLNRINKRVLPDVVRAKLNQLLMHNTFTMLQLSAEMEHVCRAMHTNQIDMLVLKGPIISEHYYGNLSLRPARDLDVLVEYEHFARSEKLLFELGYVLESEDIPRILNDLQYKTHHLCYFHPIKNVRVELHWRLSKELVREPNFRELWGRKRTAHKPNCNVHYLSDGDLFYYLTYHGASHGWFRLRWLVDIDRMVRAGVEWERVIPLLRKYDATHFAGQAAILAAMTLGTQVDSSVMNQLANRHSQRLAGEAMTIITAIMKSEVHTVTSKEIDNQYDKYFSMLLTGGQKWNSLLGKLYPSSYDAMTLPLPKYMHFMYFPLRPFLWLWRKRKQQASA